MSGSWEPCNTQLPSGLQCGLDRDHQGDCRQPMTEVIDSLRREEQAMDGYRYVQEYPVGFVAKLERKLADAEALIANWRRQGDDWALGPNAAGTFHQCADELEAVIKPAGERV